MQKPLIYVDSELAISCLVRSLCTAGFYKQAEPLLGLTVSSPDSAQYAQRIIARLPKTTVTERARQGALELLSVASRKLTKATFVQVPIDLC